MDWKIYVEGRDPEQDKIVSRRFGPGYDKPCRNPNMIECAMPECQYANRCRLLPQEIGP